MTSRRQWSGGVAKAAREKAGLRPEQVAERTGTHRATVYGWEAGREPQMRHALALADLYGVAIDRFFVHEAEVATSSDGHGKPHEPGTAAVGGSAGLAHEGA